MRSAIHVAAGLALAAASTTARVARAEIGVSGSIGVGAFGASAASTFDLGIDARHGALAVGVGGRVRVVGDEIRDEEWDEPSEAARIVRYATWRRGGVALALGPLAGVTLGEGGLVDGFTTGLDVDHGGVGAHARVAARRASAELMIDDVVAPGLVAGRARIAIASRLHAATTIAGDSRDGGAFALSCDVALGDDDAAAIAEAITIVGVGPSGQLGARAASAWGRARLEGSARLRLGAPTWFSPLYSLARTRWALEAGVPGRGAREAAPDFGAIGASVRAAARHVALGELELQVDTHAGAGHRVRARALLPSFHRAQAGASLALERHGARWVGVVALEARVRFPGALFAGVELLRLYRDLAPLWIGTISVGAVVGE